MANWLKVKAGTQEAVLPEQTNLLKSPQCIHPEMGTRRDGRTHHRSCQCTLPGCSRSLLWAGSPRRGVGMARVGRRKLQRGQHPFPSLKEGSSPHEACHEKSSQGVNCAPPMSTRGSPNTRCSRASLHWRRGLRKHNEAKLESSGGVLTQQLVLLRANQDTDTHRGEMARRRRRKTSTLLTM